MNLQTIILFYMSIIYFLDMITSVYYIGAGGRTISRSSGWYVASTIYDFIFFILVWYALWKY